MLQRAASNAYSWWWASHIRTKQSKWLEQSLQDMEEKVTAVLKLIEEDGDSFAKRAEMYYKKRPEITHFVEESYRAFRALAERYDLMSKELQNANSTLASAFPDQYQHGMDDEDEAKRPPYNNKNAPNVPKHFPAKKMKAMMVKKTTVKNTFPCKDEAVEEIDKLQKAILTKQTEKEFTKSSYESGLAKYWEIEQEITEMQQRVSNLQDEFGVGKDIEDNEARSLMLGAALKSCQETLSVLQEKQERSAADAREERKKIMDARDKLHSFKGEELPAPLPIINFNDDSEQQAKVSDHWMMACDDGGADSGSGGSGLEIKEHFETDSCPSVSEMADKIDELVGKVINLETSVSSQTAVIQRLRIETDELHHLIQELEHDKANLIDGKNTLNHKIKEMEDKLKRLQELEQTVQSRHNHLQIQFTDASFNLHQISHKLPTVKLDQGNQQTEPDKKSVILIAQELAVGEVSSAIQFQQEADQPIAVPVGEICSDIQQEQVSGKDQPPTNDAQTSTLQLEEEVRQGEDEPNWQQLFMSGLEGKEKVILNEYTSILRSYKDVKKRLNDVSENSLVELKELEAQNANKDEEIQSLRHKLILLQQKLEQHNNNIKGGDIDHLQVQDDDIINLRVEEPRSISAVEEKLRADIDEILEENLDFWMRFSSSFSQVQKLQSEIEDLHKELAKMNENEKKKKKEGSSTPDPTLKSDARPIYKHLKQLQTELTVWLEKSLELKDELTCRFSQQCRILEDITRAVSDGAMDEEMKFTSFQAAKFQGEVLNMQQENQKVEDELQAAVEHVTSLQTQVETTINRLNEEFGISGTKSGIQTTEGGGTRNRIPLGAFIFGSKTKKHKQSILSSMHPPWHKKH